MGGERIAVHPDVTRQMMGLAREFRVLPTPSEQRLWGALRNRQLDGAKFRRQQAIGSFIVDFFCAEHQLIVEVDGAIHEVQREHDEERQRMLEASGYRVVRVPAHAVETALPNVLIVINECFH
ncbi:MAG: endonuclease domain-containing protein [Thermomicrobiales bacterium]